MVGKSDFNENPVVSLDLDLDFGLRLRVCQNFKKTSSVDSEIQNDDTTLDENLQKMILSRPVDEKKLFRYHGYSVGTSYLMTEIRACFVNCSRR